ncbi:MAG: hypothetical protein OXU67_01270 [Chloroflexota bacterium]|nr:hypothetical protein [Chloroflexota bacterium]
MVALRPRQRPYTPSRLLNESVVVDVEHQLVALEAARPRSAGPSNTWTDHAAARPTVEGLWPTEIPAEWDGPEGQEWDTASLGEWEAAGVALGDGPAGPEAIPGAILDQPASRRPRRKPTRRHRASADSLAWTGPTLPALSDSPPNAPYSRPRVGSRPSATGWWWPFYLLLCGPFLALGRVLSRGRTAIPRTVLILAAFTVILVTVAASAELLHRIRTEAPAQAQPPATGAESGTGQGTETQPPEGAIPRQEGSAAPAGLWVTVANTDGQGVYLRRQPDWSSKWVAWNEGTKLHVLAAGVGGVSVRGAPSASSAAWLQVRDPDGRVGYVPEQYVTLAPWP